MLLPLFIFDFMEFIVPFIISGYIVNCSFSEHIFIPRRASLIKNSDLHTESGGKMPIRSIYADPYYAE